MIHSAAIVSPKAIVAKSAKIGPFCIIGDGVKIGDNVNILSHVCIDGDTSIGDETTIYPFTIIGCAPQDLKYRNEKSCVRIGRRNVIREHVTIHRGTESGGMKTFIGDDCLLMVGVHVAHDCTVSNNVIMANNATLGGHVVIGEYAVIGGLSAIHQFVKIGAHAMVGGFSGVDGDVIPYGSVAGPRANLLGINTRGLKRRGFDKDEVHGLRQAFQELFGEYSWDSVDNFSNRLDIVSKKFGSFKSVEEIVCFLRVDNTRPICFPVACAK